MDLRVQQVLQWSGLLQLQGDAKGAQESLETLLAEMEASPLGNEYMLCFIRISMVKCLVQAGELPDAYQLAIEVHETLSVSGDESKKTLHLQKEVFLALIKVSFESNQFAETLDFCRQYLDYIEKYQEVFDLAQEKASTLRFQGLAHFQAGENTEAISAYEASLALYSKTDGERNMFQFTDNLNLEMAMAYEKLGNKAKATACLEVCLKIRRDYFAESDEAVQSILEIMKR